MNASLNDAGHIDETPESECDVFVACATWMRSLLQSLYAPGPWRTGSEKKKGASQNV